MPYFEFQNNYHSLISVVVMKRDEDGCGQDGGWSTHGWWNINPGDSVTAAYSSNRYLYFYAQAGDGTWWGDPNGPAIYVDPYDKFDECYLIGTSTWNVVSTAQVDGGSFLLNQHTVNIDG